MKKILSLFLSLVMLLSVTAGLTFTAQADDAGCYESNHVEYFYYNKQYTAFSADFSCKKLTIRSSIPSFKDEYGDSYPAGKVTALDLGMSDAYSKKPQVQVIFIPKTVKRICYGSFEACKKLKNVYYEGSKSNWKKIKIEKGNDFLKKAKIHYNSTGIPKTVKPKGTSITKISGIGYKKAKITWKKGNKNIAGYQLQYSTNRKFKNAKTIKIKGYQKTARTLKGLTKNKKYYVRIRTYNNTAYSAWSKAKKFSTKK